MNSRLTIMATAALTILAGCSAQPEQPSTLSETSSETEQDSEEAVSILRPEVEQPEQDDIEQQRLAPLELVVGFPDGGAKLDKAAIAALKEAMQSEQIARVGAITLGGHSDAGGNSATNLRVSRQRAESVRDWLIEQGISEELISVIAFGEQNPVKPNALSDGEPNKAGRAANRRVEIQIVPVEGTLADAQQPAPATEDSTEIGD